jgi:hypothetical protein
VSKYHAIPVTIDGYRFDSKAEARHYQELCLREKAGEISLIVVHPKYCVWEHWFDGTPGKGRFDTIYYEADFCYMENGQLVVIDVKGVLTAVYRMKKKMFLAKYPDIKFVEVKA